MFVIDKWSRPNIMYTCSGMNNFEDYQIDSKLLQLFLPFVTWQKHPLDWVKPEHRYLLKKNLKYSKPIIKLYHMLHTKDKHVTVIKNDYFIISALKTPSTREEFTSYLLEFQPYFPNMQYSILKSFHWLISIW